MAKPVFDNKDFEDNHLIGAIGYILFFVPLIVNGKSRFNRFCANQGALGCIAYAAISLVSWLIGWIPLLGWLVSLLCSLLKLGVIVIMLYYGWNAYNGKAEPLPYVGGIELIK